MPLRFANRLVRDPEPAAIRDILSNFSGARSGTFLGFPKPDWRAQHRRYRHLKRGRRRQVPSTNGSLGPRLGLVSFEEPQAQVVDP
jgi:hypothetical protein